MVPGAGWDESESSPCASPGASPEASPDEQADSESGGTMARALEGELGSRDSSSARGLAQRAPTPLCEIAATGLGDLSLSLPLLREPREDFLESVPREEAIENTSAELLPLATPTVVASRF